MHRPFAMPLAVIISLAGVLGLASCASHSNPATAEKAPTKSSAAAAAPTDTDAKFCTGWNGGGGTLATIGEPVTFYPKEENTKEIQSTLDVMDPLTPPDAIAADWNKYKAFDEKVIAALDKLPAGGRLSDLALTQEGTTFRPTYKAINDWITSHC